MRSINLIWTVAALCLVFSCNPGPSKLEQRLSSYWMASCQGVPVCVVKFSDVSDMPWDRMLVFAAHATRSDFDKELGAGSVRFEEFSRKIVLVKNDQVVYSEQTPSSMEDLSNGEVVFWSTEDAAGPPVRIFTRDQAVFSVKRLPLPHGKGYFFELVATDPAVP